MSRTIRLIFSFDEEEYVSAMRLLISTKVKLSTLFATAALLVIVGIVFGLAGRNPIVAYRLLFFGLGSLSLAWFLLSVIPRRSFRNQSN